MEPLLETRDLKKSFGGVNAVDGLDFHVGEGEILGVIGPNGSGKTTLFNLVTGFLKPTAGRILFRGADITGARPHLIARRGVVRTFQLNLLFRSFTVRDNVAHAFQLQRRTGPVGAFFRPRRVRDEESHFLERADEVLEHLGMTDRRDQYARQLSYGWQKTLTLAIGLARAAEAAAPRRADHGHCPDAGRCHWRSHPGRQRAGHDDLPHRAQREPHHGSLRPHRGAQLRAEDGRRKP